MIWLEGINDHGVLTRDAPVSKTEHDALVSRIVAGYRQVIDRARAQGLRIWGGTPTPVVGNDYNHADAANDAARTAPNPRTEERRVGKEYVRMCRSGGSPYPSKTKKEK